MLVEIQWEMDTRSLAMMGKWFYVDQYKGNKSLQLKHRHRLWGGAAQARAPNNWEATMLSSVITTLHLLIFLFSLNIFDKSTPVNLVQQWDH